MLIIFMTSFARVLQTLGDTVFVYFLCYDFFPGREEELLCKENVLLYLGR